MTMISVPILTCLFLLSFDSILDLEMQIVGTK